MTERIASRGVDSKVSLDPRVSREGPQGVKCHDP